MRAVGRDHLAQRDRAGAQRQRRHGFQLALAHAQRPRQLGHACRAHLLHHLRGDGVACECARPSRSVIGWSLGGAAVAWGARRAPPPSGISTGCVDQACRWAEALLEGGAIHEGLEGGARLAPRLAARGRTGPARSRGCPPRPARGRCAGPCARKPACTRVFSLRSFSKASSAAAP